MNKALPVLASSLCNAGFTNVVQLDLERPELSITDVCSEARDADLVAFAGCMTPQWPELDVSTKYVADYLEGLGKRIPIIVGGHAAKSVESIAAVTPWITAFFDGDGEKAIVDIVKLIAEGCFRQRKHEVTGLCFVDEFGQFHKSISDRVMDLNEYDQNYRAVHIPQVHDMKIFTDSRGRQLKTGQLFTQRGCPWNCSYCSKSTENNLVPRLNEEAIRRNLRSLKAEGYEAVYLDVDTFTVNKPVARMEAEILKEEGFFWGSNTRVDMVDLDLIQHLASNNCIYMFYGVEHTQPEVLLALNKFNGPIRSQTRQIDYYRKAIRRVFTWMNEAGIPSAYFVIFGLPKVRLDDAGTGNEGYEPTTLEDDVEAVKFGLDYCNPSYLNFNVLRFMPGSASADLPNHSAFSCVRPSGDAPIDAGYFLPRLVRANGYKLQENHPVYRLCESVAANQPTTTAVNPQRVYECVRRVMNHINHRIDSSKKPTTLFIDRDILSQGLVRRDEEGRYSIAPLKEFDDLPAPQ